MRMRMILIMFVIMIVKKNSYALPTLKLKFYMWKIDWGLFRDQSIKETNEFQMVT